MTTETEHAYTHFEVDLALLYLMHALYTEVKGGVVPYATLPLTLRVFGAIDQDMDNLVPKDPARFFPGASFASLSATKSALEVYIDRPEDATEADKEFLIDKLHKLKFASNVLFPCPHEKGFRIILETFPLNSYALRNLRPNDGDDNRTAQAQEPVKHNKKYKGYYNFFVVATDTIQHTVEEVKSILTSYIFLTYPHKTVKIRSISETRKICFLSLIMEYDYKLGSERSYHSIFAPDVALSTVRRMASVLESTAVEGLNWPMGCSIIADLENFVPTGPIQIDMSDELVDEFNKLCG